MKKYLHKKEIEIPIYRGNLVIIGSNSVKKINKILPDYEKEEPYAHAWYQNWNGFQGYIVILNFHHSTSKIHHGTITHEAIHICSYLAEDRGILLDTNNDEPIAYLAQWVSDEIYKFAKENNLKIHTRK